MIPIGSWFCNSRFHTANCEVMGSKPVPPEAKLTPVIRSSLLRLVPRYAGSRSLIPSLDAAEKKKAIAIYANI